MKECGNCTHWKENREKLWITNAMLSKEVRFYRRFIRRIRDQFSDILAVERAYGHVPSRGRGIKTKAQLQEERDQ